MGKHQQEFEKFMRQLKKTIKQSRRERGDNEDARAAEFFMKRLRKGVNQSKRENKETAEAMGGGPGAYVDMALLHERESNENAQKNSCSQGKTR